MSKTISNIKFRRLIDVASTLLDNAQISRAPVNLDKVLDVVGVKVESVDLGEDVSGLLAIHKGKGIIAFNRAQSRQRRRFTIAHELGHFLLHRSHGEDAVFLDKDFIVKYRGNKVYTEAEMLQEQEANTFAASLLMPKHFIFEEFEKKDIQKLSEYELIEKLAQIFDVSVPAMTFRLANLNVLY